MRPVVFLDRDGTLNEEIGYIHDVSMLNLISGAAESVAKLNQANIATVLVSNQTGAARGFYGEEHIGKLNDRLVSLLEARGAHLDAIYYCPHLETGKVPALSIKCDCRKPEPGLVKRAYADIPGLDRSRSYVVGDKASDIELAKNCGAKAILVKTGYGQAVTDGRYQWKVEPDYTANNIIDAVNWILKDLEKQNSAGLQSGASGS
ncbi:MAG: HAD family hydrolase [Candidatus Obscuribacterales bacterium]|nr:HAD family hydrolase [Candidatus Obscuribacterales bacterium]